MPTHQHRNLAPALRAGEARRKGRYAAGFGVAVVLSRSKCYRAMGERYSEWRRPRSRTVCDSSRTRLRPTVRPAIGHYSCQCGGRARSQWPKTALLRLALPTLTSAAQRRLGGSVWVGRYLWRHRPPLGVAGKPKRASVHPRVVVTNAASLESGLLWSSVTRTRDSAQAKGDPARSAG